MPDITRDDINNVFGSDNVTTWGDINNDGNASDITARIDWAIALAEEYFNDRLEDGPYNDIDPTVSNQYKYNLAKKAGLYLYESRGYEDQGNAWAAAKKEVDDYIDRINLGMSSMSTQTRTSKNYPQVVNDD